MRALTAPRLGPYLEATGGRERQALSLYQWNIRLSGSVYEALHVFEVCLRNSMDREIAAWNASQAPDGERLDAREWLLRPAPLLARLVRPSEIEKARARAARAIRQQGRELQHDDLLAQLSLGTWRFLLPDRDPGRRLLWDEAIHRGFPHLTAEPRSLDQSVDHVYRLRNRVAHLEPLLDTASLKRRLKEMAFVLDAIDPYVSEWFTSQQRVSESIAVRPEL